jgi:hypothetical protein
LLAALELLLLGLLLLLLLLLLLKSMRCRFNSGASGAR